ncbi:hypothetical protein M8C21_018933 [Ambrosia artemisiifolia]|uniref:Uncharacterized protein n=1 Tax=Ambrosia artemisiifolia TaxID=4212 RepID=A0AAD5CA47_AMBAR|nr:hypothetical protein M8C21_018933 [Ambrosia artemisiifolia]
MSESSLLPTPFFLHQQVMVVTAHKTGRIPKVLIIAAITTGMLLEYDEYDVSLLYMFDMELM